MRLFSVFSKLPEIAERYSTENVPEGEKLTKRTLQIGAVRYRKCVAINIDAQGFYFRIHMVFGKYPQIFIPWKELRDIQESKIYGTRAKQFSIGDPPVGTIRIPEEIFNKMKGYFFDCYVPDF